MSRFLGNIGFVKTIEASPGVWTNETILKKYKGDYINKRTSIEDDGKVNANIIIKNSISIVCDNYILNNMHFLKFVELNGIRWKVNSIEINRPRLIISIGELYNNE